MSPTRARVAGTAMDFLYSLYDALVSINVPNDKARAVVDAMERDMATHLATKVDLDALRFATKSDIELLRHDMDAGFALLRKDLDVGLAAVRKDMDTGLATVRKDMDTGLAAVRKDMDAGLALVRSDMDALASRIVIRLGALIVAVAGLLLGAIQLGG